MADIQNKHSVPGAQGSRRRARKKRPIKAKNSTKPKNSTKSQKTNHEAQSSTDKPRSSARRHRDPKKPKKRERLPASLRYTETKRGKTTIRRYPGRTFYRFEEAKGKPVDFVEVFTAGGAHSIDVSFEDKTAIHFTIDPGFTLEAEYADWKTGDWRPIKRWPPIRSQGLSA
jgi:hypothetical protein